MTTRNKTCLVAAAALLAAVCCHADATGLWVGTARIREVSRPVLDTNSTWDSSTPLQAAGEFPVRLIIHVDSNGTAQLLQKVIMLADTNENEEVSLYLDEAQVDSIPEEDIVSLRRVASAAFAPMAPVVLSGTFGDTNAPLQGTVVLPHDDPANPFIHRYHPDHDNLDENFSAALTAGQESYTVNRAIELHFEGTDPEELHLGTDWGTTTVGGTYRETITGVHKAAVYIQGTFILTKVSGQGTLTAP